MSNRDWIRFWPRVVLVAGAAIVFASNGRAQDQPAPPPPNPGVPSLSSKPAGAEEPTAREAELENRVRQLEAMVNQLSSQVQQIQPKPQPPSAPLTAIEGGLGPPPPPTPNSTGPLAPGQSSPSNPAPSPRFNMPAVAKPVPTFGSFGTGFQWKTEDDEFVLQFHNLTQVDGRFYSQSAEEPVNDSFLIPREWFMFSGRIRKPYEYFLSFQNGFDSFGLLDVFGNIHYDDRLQFRVGRGKTPFTYEFYTEPIQGLIVPERSLFFNNFALNRSIGLQAWGQLNKRFDYAVGIFNTNRNGSVDFSDGKNVLGYMNYRPFADFEGSLFENLSFGGSVDSGNQVGPLVPATLRTIVPTAGNTAVGMPWLAFNPGIQEAGNHTLWDVHLAWYYNHLSLISEWGSGRQPYGSTTNFNQKVQLPIQSWYIQAGYFLTGETVSMRNVPNVIHEFDLRPGRCGLGALEVFGRYNFMELGQQVFQYNLANSGDWTRRLFLTDVGLNWYWNRWIKWTFDWEHAEFATPVLYAPDKHQITNDLYWLRFQLFF